MKNPEITWELNFTHPVGCAKVTIEGYDKNGEWFSACGLFVGNHLIAVKNVKPMVNEPYRSEQKRRG
jgi:hypothetical protein